MRYTSRSKITQIKILIKKASALTLVAGILFTSYGTHLQFSQVSAQTGVSGISKPSAVGPGDADCVANRGITPTNIEKIGLAGTKFWVKNCGDSRASISATIQSFVCTNPSGNNCAENEQKRIENATLNPGEYHGFTASDPTGTCGAAQTDITLSSGQIAAHYGSTGKTCEQPAPQPVSPLPSTQPTLDPRPNICESLTISKTSTQYNESISMSVKSTQNISGVSFAFYNVANQSNGIPQPILFNGSHFTKNISLSSLGNTASLTFNTNELNQIDTLTQTKPTYIQINAYAILPDGRVSLANPNCVVRFTISQPIPTSSSNTNLCLSTSISKTTYNSTENITITANANAPLRRFSYKFFNLDNQLNGTPQPIQFTQGVPFTITNIEANNVVTNNLNINASQLTRADRSYADRVVKYIQVNAYVTGDNGVISTATEQCVVRFTINTPTITSTPSATPSPTLIPTMPTQTPKFTTTPSPTTTTTSTPIATPNATFTSIPLATPTPTVTPTSVPTINPTNTATSTPSSSPLTQSNLKICKYEDDDGNGSLQAGENKLSWKFFYTTDGGQEREVTAHWWNLISDGCANISIPSNTQVFIREETKEGWRPTAIWYNGRKVADRTNSYTITPSTETERVLWFLNTFTPVIGGPQQSPTPSATVQASILPTTSPTATPSPSPSTTATPVITPTITPVATPTPTSSPSSSPIANQESHFKICKYNDKNANGMIDQGDDQLSWNFIYTVNGAEKMVTANWWHFWTQGCAKVDVPANSQISVREENNQGWRNTALWVNGRKVTGNTNTYTFTSGRDNVEVLWYLNSQLQQPAPSSTATPIATPTNTPVITPTFTPVPTATILPTTTATATPTATPTVTPSVTPTSLPTVTASPTAIPTRQPDVRLEKSVQGSEIRNDKVGIQYQIKVRNNENRQITVRVVDELDRTFTYDDNTTSGTITQNPSIEDISGDDNRRLIWNDISLDKYQEITISYRTTGNKEDKQYCNNAKVESSGSTVATAQACVRVDRQEVRVLAATTKRELPATGAMQLIFLGGLLIVTSLVGFKFSRYGNRLG